MVQEFKPWMLVLRGDLPDLVWRVNSEPRGFEKENSVILRM